MTDPAPPLTEAEPLSEWIARIVFAFPSGDSRRDDIRSLAAHALALESELAQLRKNAAELHSMIARGDGHGSDADTHACTRSVLFDVLEASRENSAENARLEDELVQLRREKAEREALERRRDEWLREYCAHQQVHSIDTDLNEHTVSFHDLEGAELGTGPTYEAALAAALEKVTAK
jgi:hypothetical protein